MRTVIIIAIAFVLFFVPSSIHALEVYPKSIDLSKTNPVEVVIMRIRK